MQVVGALRGADRRLDDDTGDQRVDAEIDEADDAAEEKLTPHGGGESLAMAHLLSALSRRNQTADRREYEMRWEEKNGQQGQEKERKQRQAAANAAPEGQGAALAALVGQSGKPRHDGALSRALHELRSHAERAALRQADYRHRADRLRPLALQPASSR